MNKLTNSQTNQSGLTIYFNQKGRQNLARPLTRLKQISFVLFVHFKLFTKLKQTLSLPKLIIFRRKIVGLENWEIGFYLK